MTARRARLAAGLFLAAGYLAVGALTLRVSGRHVRPLFDSFANLPYEWVCPPPALKTGNIAPTVAKVSVPLIDGGIQASSPSTQDGQILFSLAQGAIPPHPPDTTVVVTIEPLCASSFGAVPGGFSPAGNAYRLSFAYEPSGTPATRTSKPGDVVLKPPTSAQELAYSGDGGKSWTLLNSFHSGTSLAASFSEPGIYLLLQRGLATVSGGGGSGGGSVLPYVGAGVTAVIVVAGVALYGRHRRRQAG